MQVDERAPAALRDAAFVVVFTGAGVSAESGLPTYRSGADGLWKRADFERFANPTGYRRHVPESWRWYHSRARFAATVQPNAAHRAIAEIERRAREFLLVTQNIDGLHQRAGSTQVIELHGSLRHATCFDCPATTPWPDDAGEPQCPACGGLLRPAVVMFHEHLPAGAMEQALDAARRCDLLISVGTSSAVWPAAEVPVVARAAGAEVWIVNPDVDGQMPETDRVLHMKGPAGVILPPIVEGAWPG